MFGTPCVCCCGMCIVWYNVYYVLCDISYVMLYVIVPMMSWPLYSNTSESRQSFPELSQFVHYVRRSRIVWCSAHLCLHGHCQHQPISIDSREISAKILQGWIRIKFTRTNRYSILSFWNCIIFKLYKNFC